MKALDVIYPSIYSSDHLHIYDELKKVENARFRTLHVDIQDGVCSSEISFGIKVLKSLSNNSEIDFDVHLMLVDVEQFLNKIEGIKNIKCVTFHPTDVRYPARIINKIKSMGYEVGFAFGYSQPMQEYALYADEVSSILICTADVDGKGNEYRKKSLDKIQLARSLFDGVERFVVDGDVNAMNLGEIVQAGANRFVMGREIFKSTSLDEKIIELNNILERK